MGKYKFDNELYFCVRADASQVKQYFEHSYITPNRLEIIFVDEGTMKVQVNDSEMLLTPSQIVLLHPQQEIRILEIDKTTKVNVLGFMPVLQDAILKQFSISFFQYFHSHPRWTLDEKTQQAIRSYFNLFQYNLEEMNGPVTTEIANSLFGIFLQMFYHKIKAQINLEEQSGKAMPVRTIGGKFLQLLNVHFKKEHSVNFYAEKLCISSKYLTQIVKSVTNRTPKEMIDKRLGMESLFLLTKTDLNIQEISIELGFPDQSYFGRFFKRLFKIAPMHYRLNPDLKLMEKLENSKYDKEEQL